MSIKPLTIKHYIDPGHGWFAVRRSLLEELGLLDKISSYSYQKGTMVYLEEDCDASLLLNELDRRVIPWMITTVHHDIVGKYSQSPIRSYECFNPDSAPIGDTYLALLKAMGEWIDDNQGSQYLETMVRIRNIFLYESRYSKKPDTRQLKIYRNWIIRCMRATVREKRKQRAA